MWTCLNLYKLLVLFDSKSTYRPNILSPWYYFFLRSEIGIFNNFVKTVGLVKNTGTWTRRQSLSTGTLHTSSSLIQWNIEVCFLHYSLLIQSLSCIKCFNWEGLPFWNREKERTGSTFLNLLQPPSFFLIRNKLLRNCHWTGWVFFIAPFLNIFNSDSRGQFASCLF